MNSVPDQDCQVAMLDDIRIGEAQIVHRSLRKRILLSLSRQIDSKTKRRLKRYYYWLRPGLAPPKRGTPMTFEGIGDVQPEPVPLKAGDRVRVKSWPEIAATLDGYRKLKGCRFMPEMDSYSARLQDAPMPVAAVGGCRTRRMNGLISTGTIVTCWQASTGGVMPIWQRRVSASAVSLSAKKSCPNNMWRNSSGWQLT